jgi:hypothetical protein
MTEKTIEIEAETLEEARAQVKSQIPEGLCLLSEQVISDGKPKTVKATGDTTETAFAKALVDIPNNASIIEKKVLTVPELKVVTVEAFNEQVAGASARFEARQLFGDAASVVSLRLSIMGNKGILGIGKKPNQYEVEILLSATVEVVYQTKAKIIARVEIPQKKGTTAQASKELLADIQELVDPASGLSAEDVEEIIKKFKYAGKEGVGVLHRCLNDAFATRA